MRSREHDNSIATSSFAGGVLLFMCTLLGCGGLSSSSGTGGANGGTGGAPGNVCSPAVVPPAPPPLDGNASVQAKAEAEQMGVLDRLFGQYLRGDIVVYRGTMQGRRSITAPAGYPAIPDEELASGPALARLAVQPAWSGDWVQTPQPPPIAGPVAILLSHSVSAAQYMVFQQAEDQPGSTAAGSITDDNSDNFLVATCSDCAPSFWTRPATLAFSLTAKGTMSIWEGDVSTGGAYYDVPVQTTATVDITAAAPCSVTYDELVTLNGATGPNEFADSFGLWQFALSGTERVWHAQGSILVASPSAHGRCDGQAIPYTIDLYVKAANLAEYGVRNYVQLAPVQLCAV
jgi:hypothetical protein